MAFLALVGGAISVYLAIYQLRFVYQVWEPFFGEGSRQILRSNFSEALPIPDAALGAAGYFLELLLLLVGGTQRWRTLPAVVICYGAVIGLFGVVSVVLVGLQFFLFHTFCTLCLASAAISLTITVLGFDEPLASLRYKL